MGPVEEDDRGSTAPEDKGFTAEERGSTVAEDNGSTVPDERGSIMTELELISVSAFDEDKADWVILFESSEHPKMLKDRRVADKNSRDSNFFIGVPLTLNLTCPKNKFLAPKMFIYI